MFPEMRRKDRALTKEEAYGILEKAEYGVLSTMGVNGFPYGVPLNYVVMEEKIYFHCALDVGSKIENIRKNANVCFTAVGYTEPLPEKFATVYESVTAFGLAKEADTALKRAALYKLIEKYSADYIDAGLRYIDKLIEEVAVYEISIEQITGKARKKVTKRNLDYLGHKEQF